MFDDSKMIDRFIKFMEREHKVPWHSSVLINASALGGVRANGEPYKGVNMIDTWMDIEERGLDSRIFLTFPEIKKRNGRIKEGSSASMIVYPIWLDFDEKDNKLTAEQARERKAEGKKVYVRFCGYRYYNVFSICDTTIPYEPDETLIERPELKDTKAEAIVEGWNYGPRITHSMISSGDGAYDPVFDKIIIPTIGCFKSPANYYSTLFHELTHSTGHIRRLRRPMDAKYRSIGYAKEELIAEIGASMLLARTELANEDTEQNSEAYVNGWMQRINGVKGFIPELMSAWSKAEKAVEWIMNDTPMKTMSEVIKETA